MTLRARQAITGVIVLSGAEVVYRPTGEAALLDAPVRASAPGIPGLVQVRGSSAAAHASDYGLEVVDLSDGA